jgi:hypothetical protein
MAYFVSVMADAWIRTHAQLLGLSPEQLSAALFQHATRELADWVTEQENRDPGGWVAGDAAPDWLLPYIESLRHGMATRALAALAQEVD